MENRQDINRTGLTSAEQVRTIGVCCQGRTIQQRTTSQAAQAGGTVTEVEAGEAGTAQQGLPSQRLGLNTQRTEAGYRFAILRLTSGLGSSRRYGHVVSLVQAQLGVRQVIIGIRRLSIRRYGVPGIFGPN